jgi:tetratricopeptide (TPR) repeat protein
LVVSRQNTTTITGDSDEAHFRRFQAETAIEFLRRFSTAESMDVDKRLQTGIAQVHLGRVFAAIDDSAAATHEYQRAAHTFEALTADFPHEPLFRTELASAETILASQLHAAGMQDDALLHFSRAERQYREALRLNALERHALICLASLKLNCPAREIRNPVVAEQLAGRLIASGTVKSRWFGRCLRGVARYRQGDFEKAIRDLADADRDLDGKSSTYPANFLFFRALSLQKIGEHALAKECYGTAKRRFAEAAQVEDDFGIRLEAATVFEDKGARLLGIELPSEANAGTQVDSAGGSEGADANSAKSAVE